MYSDLSSNEGRCIMGEDPRQLARLGIAINESSRMLTNILNMLDSDSEEEQEEWPTYLLMLQILFNLKGEKPTRVEDFYLLTIPNYTNRQFQSHFRLTRNSFNSLVRLLRPYLQGDEPRPLRAVKLMEKQILAVVWLLATPDSYRSVGDRFDYSKGGLWDAFYRVILGLCKVAPLIIKWPEFEERRNISQDFSRFAQVNNVVGAVDGSYVPIKAPKQNANVYITRKCNYAMTLQAIAIPSLKFIDCCIEYPGSVHDGRIFRLSSIFRNISANQINFLSANQYILGDKAYPLLSWCIPPYIQRGALNPIQTYFNTVHAKTRQVVERSFALLFGRFRRLKYLDMGRTDLIPATVLACCVMHNVCLDGNDAMVRDYIEEARQFNRQNPIEYEEVDEDGEGDREANNIRDRMANEIYAGRPEARPG